MLIRRLCLLVCCCSLFTSAQPSVSTSRLTIPFWHSFAGSLGQSVKVLVKEFNQSQQRYYILPVYKGSYPETFTSFVSAFRAKKHPPLVQIFEIGTNTLLHPKGIIRPLHQVMKEAGVPFDSGDIISGIRRYYNDSQGQLQAMPFNSSSAVLYVNATQFKRAGLRTLPTTWPEVDAAAKRLIASGAACGFTSTYPSWVHIETFAALHGLPFVDKNDGVGARDARLIFGSNEMLFHLKKLKSWQDSHVFEYGGRDSNAVALFTSGHCAMLVQSSGSYMSLKQLVPFQLAVSPMPYWPQLRRHIGNSAIGGGALWVTEGFDARTYHGVAAFLAFLAKPQTQVHWQQMTGYLPVSNKAASVLLHHPASEAQRSSIIALKQISQSTTASVGARLGSYAQIRLFNDEQLEAILSGSKPPIRALSDAVIEGNYQLRRFEKNVTRNTTPSV